jgi:hypothetical protein
MLPKRGKANDRASLPVIGANIVGAPPLADPEMLPFLDGLDGIGDLQHGGRRQRKRRDG